MARLRNTVLDGIETLRRSQLGNSTTAVALLYIAENPGIGTAELAHLCQVSVATASRTVRALLPASDPNALQPALGLVEDQHPASSVRARSYFLTESGHRLCAKVDVKIQRGAMISSRGRVSVDKYSARSSVTEE